MATGSYEKEQEYLQSLWNSVESDSEDDFVDKGSDSADDDEDTVSVNSVHSDSENFVENDPVTHENMQDENNHLVFMGKNNITKWSKHHASTRVRTGAENLIRKLPAPKRDSKDAKTPLQCWYLLFDETILQSITTCTNIVIGKKLANYKNQRSCGETNTTEIKAVLGILYLAGVYKSSHRHLKDLWRTDGGGIEIFRAVMSFNRFSFLLLCLRFDNVNNRQMRLQIDKLAPIRAIFEQFVINCQQAYSPGQYLTIDEKLESFRGRCSFRQYIPNKPAKYGIKIHALVDARTYFVVNMEIYAGIQPDGVYKISNTSIDVIDRLVAPISGSNRNVTFDNWYTSYPAMKMLREKHKLTAVGTLRKNKVEIPPLFLNRDRTRPFRSSMFSFQKDYTLVSYIPKRNKNVVLLSSLHHDDTIDPNSGDKMLPEIITFYNSTKGGVDTVDEMSGNYSVARNCRRWPLRIFFSIIDTAGINSQQIYKANTQDFRKKRRIFLEELGLALTKPALQARKNNPRIPRNLRMKIAEILDEPIEVTTNLAVGGYVRCHICSRTQDRKTKYRCTDCNTAICLSHAKLYCQNCTMSIDE